MEEKAQSNSVEKTSPFVPVQHIHETQASESDTTIQCVATLDLRKEFVLIVLEAEEKRRDAVENKSSILLASNAILLSAIISFVLPLKLDNNPLIWIQTVLMFLAFGLIIFSILFSAQVFAPFSNQKSRSKIMDLGSNPESEHNLFLFSRIAQFRKADYQQAIDTLTEREILDQLTSQVHNLSRLLIPRYQKIGIAQQTFMLGAIIFALLAATKLFSP